MPTGEHRGDDDAPIESGGELLDRWQAHQDAGPERQAPTRPTPRHAATGADQASAPLPADHLADHNIAAREVMAAFGTEPPPVQDPAPVLSETTSPSSPSSPSGRAGRRNRPEPVSAGTSTDVDFPVKRGTRTLTGLVALVGLVATILVAVVAYDQRTTLAIGAAATLGLATLAVWGVRAGSSTTSLSIRSRQLIVEHGNRRDVVDLASRFTRVETVGKPGSRSWKVLIERLGQDPLVIDRSIVDPQAFTDALAAHRPATSPDH